MRSTSMAFALLTLCGMICDARATDVIRVVKIDNTVANTFDFGERCVFDVTLPDDTQIRLRVIRGTKKRLIQYATRPWSVTDACIDYHSLLVRPVREGNDLDLDFYLDEGWLSADGRSNGEFVFVVERDDQPAAPVWETSRLRLPADLRKVEAYFNAGVDVIVKRPRHVVVRPAGGHPSLVIGSPQQTCVDLEYDRRQPWTMEVHRTTPAAVEVTASGHRSEPLARP